MDYDIKVYDISGQSFIQGVTEFSIHHLIELLSVNGVGKASQIKKVVLTPRMSAAINKATLYNRGSMYPLDECTVEVEDAILTESIASIYIESGKILTLKTRESYH
jgi:hypothetical protein